jgi:hypothetical protein
MPLMPPWDQILDEISIRYLIEALPLVLAERELVFGEWRRSSCIPLLQDIDVPPASQCIWSTQGFKLLRSFRCSLPKLFRPTIGFVRVITAADEGPEGWIRQLLPPGMFYCFLVGLESNLLVSVKTLEVASRR